MDNTTDALSLGAKLGLNPGASFSDFRDQARKVVGRAQNGKIIDGEIVDEATLAQLSKITNYARRSGNFESVRDQPWEAVVPEVLRTPDYITAPIKDPEEVRAQAEAEAAKAKAEADAKVKAEAEAAKAKAKAEADAKAKAEAEAAARARAKTDDAHEQAAEDAQDKEHVRQARQADWGYAPQYNYNPEKDAAWIAMISVQRGIEKDFIELAQKIEANHAKFEEYVVKDFENQVRKAAPDFDAYSIGLALMKSMHDDILQRHEKVEEIKSKTQQTIDPFNKVVDDYSIFADGFAPLLVPHIKSLGENNLVTSFLRKRTDGITNVHKMLSVVTSDEQLEALLKEIKTSLKDAPAFQQHLVERATSAIDGTLKVLGDYKLSQGDGVIGLLNRMKNITTECGMSNFISNTCSSGKNNTDNLRNTVNWKINLLQNAERSSIRSALNYFEVLQSHACSADLERLGAFGNLSGFSDEQKQLFSDMKRIKKRFDMYGRGSNNHQPGESPLVQNLAAAISYSSMEALGQNIVKAFEDARPRLEGIERKVNPYDRFRQDNQEFFDQTNRWLASTPRKDFMTTHEIRERRSEGQAILEALAEKLKSLPPLPQDPQRPQAGKYTHTARP